MHSFLHAGITFPLCGLTRSPIPAGALVDHLEHNECGAQVAFMGRVRNQTAGRAVTWLEYEAQEVLAPQIMHEVITEATGKFQLHFACCIHRLGRLYPGDCAVLVVTATPHRKAAYGGNQYIIDEVKRRAPIWKKESFVDGSEAWP
ncbi:MAG: molybdenum cofactor biosynthesis protein MoaE [Spirochaetales bacterium]|nr:molybdenum cofactor biosynthesis protein MoaE [Spirochaetales bacterium]